MCLTLLLLGSTTSINSCKPANAYCSFATRSNGCDIDKNMILCFKCDGNSCPDLVNKQVYIKKGENDSCLVSLGNKITDCAKCAEGDSVVVLSSIVME